MPGTLMGWRAAAWIGMGAALVLVSCGRSEGGAQPIARADLPGRTAHLVCQSLAGCCKSSGMPLDTAACELAQTGKLELELEQDGQGRMRYDAQAASDCIEGVLSKIQCGDIDSDGNPACLRIFVGDVGLGQPCDESYECASVNGHSASCQSSDGVSPTVCTANVTPQHGKQGDACVDTCFEDRDCADHPTPSPGLGGAPAPEAALVACYRADGLFCDVGRCSPLLALGEACGDDAACHAGTFCNSITGLCNAPLLDGSRCDAQNQCQSGRCREASSGAGAEQTRVCLSSTTPTAGRCEGATEPLPDDIEAGSTTPDPGAGAGTR